MAGVPISGTALVEEACSTRCREVLNNASTFIGIVRAICALEAVRWTEADFVAAFRWARYFSKVGHAIV